MIRAEFTKRPPGFLAVRVKGHAGFGRAGRDIVCAGVSSAVRLTANAITEVLGVPAAVSALGGEVSIILPQNPDPRAQDFLAALHLHLTQLQQEYPRSITVTVLEVEDDA